MAVNLQKGQKISLTKEVPGIKNLRVGLGWDEKKGLLGCSIDVDASVLCYAGDKIDETVYFGNLSAYRGAIKHNGDNLTGAGEGDDEQIEIKLDQIPSKINKLRIIINIYAAYRKKQDFSKIQNCFVRIVNIETNKEEVRYDVSGNYDKKTGMYVADICRNGSNWDVIAIGEGVRVADIDEMKKRR